MKNLNLINSSFLLLPVKRFFENFHCTCVIKLDPLSNVDLGLQILSGVGSRNLCKHLYLRILLICDSGKNSCYVSFILNIVLDFKIFLAVALLDYWEVFMACLLLR